MKKVTALFLVLALLMCNLLMVSAANSTEGDAVVEVAYVGEEGIVELTVSTATAAAAGTITLTYDNRTLTLLDTELATDYSSLKTDASQVSCTYVNRPAKAGTLALFRFSFDAAVEETTKVDLVITVTDAEENTAETKTSLVLELATAASRCPSEAYKDLDSSEWYHEATDYVISKGIMNGVTANTFDPNGTTTRAMFVTILGRSAGVDEERYNTMKVFDDVAADQWYTPYVNWACENGIVNGRGDGKFCPQDPITRQEMVAILARFATVMGVNATAENPDVLKDFADADQVSAYAVEAFAWAVEQGIVNGTGAGLEPKGLATRVQTAQIICKFQTTFES